MRRADLIRIIENLPRRGRWRTADDLDEMTVPELRALAAELSFPPPKKAPKKPAKAPKKAPKKPAKKAPKKPAKKAPKTPAKPPPSTEPRLSLEIWRARLAVQIPNPLTIVPIVHRDGTADLEASYHPPSEPLGPALAAIGEPWYLPDATGWWIRAGVLAIREPDPDDLDESVEKTDELEPYGEYVGVTRHVYWRRPRSVGIVLVSLEALIRRLVKGGFFISLVMIHASYTGSDSRPDR